MTKGFYRKVDFSIQGDKYLHTIIPFTSTDDFGHTRFSMVKLNGTNSLNSETVLGVQPLGPTNSCAVLIYCQKYAHDRSTSIGEIDASSKRLVFSNKLVLLPAYDANSNEGKLFEALRKGILGSFSYNILHETFMYSVEAYKIRFEHTKANERSMYKMHFEDVRNTVKDINAGISAFKDGDATRVSLMLGSTETTKLLRE